MDVHPPKVRSYNMSRIRSKNTKPEIIVRSLVHSLGYRYRLHRKDLPGCPDLVFPSLRKLIFVHGCFWHLHNCRYGKVKPKNNAEFWEEKRLGNKKRDRRNERRLKKLGWEILNLWECQVKDKESIARIVKAFLDRPQP